MNGRVPANEACTSGRSSCVSLRQEATMQFTVHPSASRPPHLHVPGLAMQSWIFLQAETEFLLSLGWH